MTAESWIGIATCITATAAAIVSIIVAIRQPAIGKKVDDVHAAVSMSNGSTLGQVIEKIDRSTGEPDPTPIP